MKTIPATAKTNSQKLIDEATVMSEPVQITADAVRKAMACHSEDDYLLSIPGMRASIRKGMAIPVNECVESLDWGSEPF